VKDEATSPHETRHDDTRRLAERAADRVGWVGKTKGGLV
jgi:hypothetical protein